MRRRSKSPFGSWPAAALFSAVLHAGVVVVLGWAGGSRTLFPGLVIPAAPSEVSVPTVVDLRAVDLVDPALGALPGAPLPSPSQAEGDRTLFAARPTVTAVGQVPVVEAGAPAPDRGDGQGRELPPAFRRDVSTLRERASDGARAYQTSRERLAKRAASAQALRREPIVGTGDSRRTKRPAPSEPTPKADLAGSTDEATRLASTPGLRSDEHGRDSEAGEGPLDATAGPKAFDVEATGRVAEVQAARASSNELHPGRADFTAVATPAPRDGVTGRGPATQPGVTTVPTGGTQPTLPGAQGVVPGPANDLDTVERVYARELGEIRRRISQVGLFPKRLALALEQGEAIVQFTVDAWGRVVGDVTLLKSAGFAEFDEEAVARVRRAAPFPGMRRALPVRLRVSFDNPVIR